MRHTVEFFTLAGGRREHGEDLPAVVIHDDQHERRGCVAQERQRIEIVQRGEIAQHRKRGFTGGALHARRGGDQPVDAARATVAVDRITGGQLRQRIHQPHRQAVAEKKLSIRRQKFRQPVRYLRLAPFGEAARHDALRLRRQPFERLGPRHHGMRRMVFKPCGDIRHQPTPAMMRRIEPPGQRIDNPVLLRTTFALPLQYAFTGQAAAKLHDNLRLRQQRGGIRVREPEIGARQRLAGLRQYIADQRPAKTRRPLRDVLAFLRREPACQHHAALFAPERPVSLRADGLRILIAQPGRVHLPPFARRLLPRKARIVQLAIERFGERTVDMQRACL
ncbi:hypothetical protein BN132_1142 [Cronobacter turicensis 564]|nr:hypothetical protein BN132_1142 [Cronobacter turicensis 564]